MTVAKDTIIVVNILMGGKRTKVLMRLRNRGHGHGGHQVARTTYGDLEQEDKGSVDGDLSKKDEILNEVTFKARRMRMRMRRMMGTETTYGPGRFCQHEDENEDDDGDGDNIWVSFCRAGKMAV